MYIANYNTQIDGINRKEGEEIIFKDGTDSSYIARLLNQKVISKTAKIAKQVTAKEAKAKES